MSALQAQIGCAIAQLVTAPRLQELQRKAYATVRQLSGRKPTVHYFHQHDDPYSHLLAQYLPALQERYRINVVAHAVPAPHVSAAPDLQRLGQWSARDAKRLSYGLPMVAAQPNRVFLIQNPTPAALQRGAALRKKWGHYLGAMLYFEGEWYWGTDRLHYLEERLTEAGLRTNPTDESDQKALIPVRDLALVTPPVRSTSQPVIHFYCSLRSPYTYLAAPQVRQLAQHYGAELRIRFVLPMVMRGLPVPLNKRLYILKDTKREAERLGMDFGAVVDPVGPPVEAGLALLHAACATHRGPALLESFLSAVFAEGLDAGSARGLRLIAQRAGFTPLEVDAALADESWSAVAEANRADLQEQGLWGVPSFRVNDRPALWGQDRLWMLEEDLFQALTGSTT